jgi:outer membrane protein assembly factor BamB
VNDTSGNPYLSTPISVDFTTLPISVPTPTITVATPPTVNIRFGLGSAVPAGLFGTLLYTLGGVPYTYSIPAGVTVFDLSEVFYATTITAFIRYTDNFNNTLNSGITTINYVPTVWPSFQRDNFASGKSAYFGRNTVPTSAKWTFTAAAAVYATPIIGSDGTIYFTSQSPGTLYAVNALTGALKWSYSFGVCSITSAAAVDDTGTVYVGLQSPLNAVYALTAPGVVKWSRTTGGNINAGITVGNGIVYFGSTDFNMYALTAATGAIRWQRNLGNYIASPATIANDGTVFIGTFNGQLVALNGVTGATVWSSSVFRPGTGTGYVNGSAPVISYDGFNYFITIAAKNTVTNQAILTRFFYIAGPLNGTIQWSFPYDNFIQSPSFDVSLNFCYIGTNSAVIRAIGSNGAPVWQNNTPNNNPMVSASISIDASSNIFYTAGNTLYAYVSKSSGPTLLWSYQNPDGGQFSPATPVIGVDGTIYVGTMSGRLMAL